MKPRSCLVVLFCARSCPSRCRRPERAPCHQPRLRGAKRRASEWHQATAVNKCHRESASRRRRGPNKRPPCAARRDTGGWTCLSKGQDGPAATTAGRGRRREHRARLSPPTADSPSMGECSVESVQSARFFSSFLEALCYRSNREHLQTDADATRWPVCQSQVSFSSR